MKENIKIKLEENYALFQVEVFDEIESYQISLNDLFSHKWETDSSIPKAIKTYLKLNKKENYNMILDKHPLPSNNLV